MIGEAEAVEEPGTALHDLAAAAERGRDVALAASGGVEDRADAIGNRLGSGELGGCGQEVALVVFDHRRVRRVHQIVLLCAELFSEPVRQDVESRRGVGDAALGFDPGAERHYERQRARAHTHTDFEHTTHGLPLSPSSGLLVGSCLRERRIVGVRARSAPAKSCRALILLVGN